VKHYPVVTKRRIVRITVDQVQYPSVCSCRLKPSDCSHGNSKDPDRDPTPSRRRGIPVGSYTATGNLITLIPTSDRIGANPALHFDDSHKPNAVAEDKKSVRHD
jgi:hypothetical protein